MGAHNALFVCLLSAIPGFPPGVQFEDSYISLFPVDKTKCDVVDPVRDIQYQLYTRNNPTEAQYLALGNDEALSRSFMNFSDPTVIYFHAFLESSTTPSATAIKTGYLQLKKHNIILLQAQRLEAGPWYFTAARNTRVVGEYTARFIDYLVARGLQLSSLHLIGLSLGAQMAAVTGSNVRSGKVSRITGLDPAAPLFTKWPNSLKLDSSDAEFVDVIHTDAGIFGYPRAIGHVDFWPNMGISPQPGCLISEVFTRNPDSIIEKVFCSHWRSYQFYAESITNEDSFVALRCENWDEFVVGNCDSEQPPVNMGYGLRKAGQMTPGNYFLTTRSAPPFSMQLQPPSKK